MAAQRLSAIIDIQTKAAQAALDRMVAANQKLESTTNQTSKAFQKAEAESKTASAAYTRQINRLTKLEEAQRQYNQELKKTRAISSTPVGAAQLRVSDKPMSAASKYRVDETLAAQAELRAQQKITEEGRTQVQLGKAKKAHADAEAAQTRAQAAAEKRVTDAERARLAIQRAQIANQTAQLRLASAINAEQYGGLASMRYALYDVSNGTRILGTALLALGAIPSVFAVSWERSLADVVRTNTKAGDDIAAHTEFIKAQFMDLVSTMPIKWDELMEIGTLAGQLGIAESELKDFTTTVAQFAAITDVSIEDAATAFGRIASFFPGEGENFKKIGDAIAKVGVNSVATESQIVNITTQISSLTAAAGMSANETIGFAGALASIAVAPELSRGVITRVFGRINRSIAEGTEKLDTLGRVSGMSGEQFAKAWSTDSAKTFTTFMAGIREQGDDAEGTLRALGITSVRDVPVLMRLANAADSTGKAGGLIAQTFEDAADSSGELQRQYQIISQTSGAKLQVMLQSIQALLVKIGETNLGFLSDMFDDVADGARALADSLEEPARLFGFIDLGVTNGELLGFASLASVVVGGLGLIVSGLGRVAAGILAMKLLALEVGPVMRKNFNMGLGSLTGMATAANKGSKSLGGVVTAANNSAKGLRNYNYTISKAANNMNRMKGMARGAAGAIGGLGKALWPVAAIAASFAVIDWAKGASESATDVDEFTRAVLDSGAAMDQVMDIQSQTAASTIGFGNATKNAFDNIEQLRNAIQHLNEEGGAWADMAQLSRSGIYNPNGSFTYDQDYATTFDDITNVLDTLDASFAQLVDNGNVPQATDMLFQFLDATKASDRDIKAIINHAPEIKDWAKSWLLLNNFDADDDAIVKFLGRTGEAWVAYTKEVAEANGVSQNTLDAIGGADVFQAFSESISKGASSFFDLTGAYDAVIEKNKEWAKEQAEATETAKDTWQDFYDGQSVNLDDYLAERQKQVDAEQAWAKNLSTLTQQLQDEGVAPDLIQQIIQEFGEAGKDAAPILESLVGGTPEQRAKYVAQAETIGQEVGGALGAEIATGVVAGLVKADLISRVSAVLGDLSGSYSLYDLFASTYGEDKANEVMQEFLTWYNTLGDKAKKKIDELIASGKFDISDLMDAGFTPEAGAEALNAFFDGIISTAKHGGKELRRTMLDDPDLDFSEMISFRDDFNKLTSTTQKELLDAFYKLSGQAREDLISAFANGEITFDELVDQLLGGDGEGTAGTASVTVDVGADTTGAKNSLNAFTNGLKGSQNYLDFGADTDDAKHDIAGFRENEESQFTFLKFNSDTDTAASNLGTFRGAQRAILSPVRFKADTSLARRNVSAFRKVETGRRSDLKIGANTTPGRNTVRSFRNSSVFNTRYLSVDANTSRARNAIARLATTVSVGVHTLKRADGGPVYGPGTSTSDSIPAWLSDGEFVMKASAVQKYGLGLMHMLNAGKFASGGHVTDNNSDQYTAYASSRAMSYASKSALSVVELSPVDRRLLAAAGNVTLLLDGRVVSKSVNNATLVASKRGTN